VTAQVLVMTPAAFIHMTPDPWVSDDLLTIPELLQFDFDLVIVDEVDSFQKTLDGLFSPRETLMGTSGLSTRHRSPSGLRRRCATGAADSSRMRLTRGGRNVSMNSSA
jgi:hypothetical protein